VTFNATLTALIACILVMFFLHQLQQAQIGWCWMRECTSIGA